MMRYVAWIAAGALALAAAAPAAAAYQVYTFSGTFNEASCCDGLLGQAFSGTIKFDDARPGNALGPITTYSGGVTLALAFAGNAIALGGSESVVMAAAAYGAPYNGVIAQFEQGSFSFYYLDSSFATASGPALPNGPDYFAATVQPLSLAFDPSTDIGAYAGISYSDGANSFFGGINTLAYAGTEATPAVPEPASWGLMILGFGAVGGAMRYRRPQRSVRFA